MLRIPFEGQNRHAEDAVKFWETLEALLETMLEMIKHDETIYLVCPQCDNGHFKRVLITMDSAEHSGP